MKITFKNILMIFSLIIIVLFNACNKDEESADARTKRLLQSSWRLKQLTVDGAGQTAMFNQFVLNVAAETYTTQNGGPQWPAAGTWQLTGPNVVTRDGDLDITINTLNETTLIISFTWTKTTYTSGGRSNSISGVHVFEFEKQ